MKKWLCSIVLMAPLVAVSQQNDTVFLKRLSNEILNNGKAYYNLRVLCKNMGGRVSGSPNMYRAEQWGYQTLKHAGADSVWMQECTIPHWIRGGKEKAVVTIGNQKKELSVTALGNSVGTGEKPLVAEIIPIRSFDELEQKKESLKGKLVFFTARFNNQYIRTFESYSQTVAYRTEGPARAARYGAVGVWVRSMSHSADNLPHTGTTRYNDSFPKIPALALGLEDADWLEQSLQNRKARGWMQSFGKMLPDTIAHNIIGELKGSEQPEQIITLGAHLDSWDLGEGAHDDGAGIVQTIEVLRAFQALGYHPKHTIRFVLFANEENGLRGGNAYAEAAQQKGEKHLFAFESDAGGFTPRAFSFGGSAEQLKKLQTWLPLLQPYGISEINAGGDGSDIGPLQKKLNLPVGGNTPDSQRYFDYHHAASDAFETVNKRELHLSAATIAQLIYLIDQHGL